MCDKLGYWLLIKNFSHSKDVNQPNVICITNLSNERYLPYPQRDLASCFYLEVHVEILPVYKASSGGRLDGNHLGDSKPNNPVHVVK